MNSYPTTRFGKIHIRFEARPVDGDTLCGRLASEGASVSLAGDGGGNAGFGAPHVANCKRCMLVFETAAALEGEASADPLVASVFRQ